MAEIDTDVIQRILSEIDELLGMRRGFNDTYRDWRERTLDVLRAAIGEDRVAELEQLGPRRAPINRQHRVHIYRQRLHAQRKYLVDLIESANTESS